MYYCGECRKTCTVHAVDQGIGPGECHGRPFRDVAWALESDCCDGDVYDDEACECRASYLTWADDQEAQRADHEYERRRDERLEAG